MDFKFKKCIRTQRSATQRQTHRQTDRQSEKQKDKQRVEYPWKKDIKILSGKEENIGLKQRPREMGVEFSQSMINQKL